MKEEHARRCLEASLPRIARADAGIGHQTISNETPAACIPPFFRPRFVKELFVPDANLLRLRRWSEGRFRFFYIDGVPA